MSNEPKPIPPRLIDLMVEDATQGLTPQDEAELSAAIAQDELVRAEAEAYAMAATAIELSLSQSQRAEALPDALRKKLIATATRHVQADASAPVLKLNPSTTDKPAAPAAAPFSFTDGRMFGWYAAIAALVALAFVLTFEPTPQQTNDPVPTLAEQYDALANDADTITAAWGFNADGGDPAYANTTGQVIWNADEQTGYMKLAGLPVNDPDQFQYQLWIVDASRDPKIENTNRVDGGVFDITAQGEVIVPINAKLLARNAAAFAITVEAPGGVVESKGPLQVLAAVEQKS